MNFLKRLKANISLNFNKATLNLGENLEGILGVTSEEEFDVIKTRVGLDALKKGMNITAANIKLCIYTVDRLGGHE